MLKLNLEEIKMNQKKETPKLSTSITTELNSLPTISSKIRYLNKKGYDRGDISRILQKRYQHVRNVLITPLSSK